ncbi:MAG: PAS domain S-box protein [Archaeoglobaceae archaeon]
MISRVAVLTIATSVISILMTYFIISFNLPLSFLIYVIIITFGIGIFASGDVFKQIFEIRDVLQKRDLLVHGKNEFEEIKLSLEEVLKRSDENNKRLESIIKAIGDINAWIFEVENGKIVHSIFAEKVLGLKDSEVIGKEVSEIFTNFDSNCVCEAIGRDGVISVELRSFGKIYIARNIEKVRKMEKELALLKAVFEHSIDAIVILDLDSKIVSWNKGAEIMFGYKAEEVIGKPFLILLPQELWDLCRENFKKAVLEGFVKDIESIRIAKNGEKLIVDQTLTSIYSSNGELVGFVSIMRDITKKKETEMKLVETCEELEKKTRDLLLLQKELEYLARIVETSNDAIYSVDINGKIKSWNRTAEKLFGWKKEEIIGKDSSILLPEEIKNETSIILQRISEGQKELRFETRRLTKGGEIISVEVTISPIDDSGFSVIVRPIADDFEKRMFKFYVERGRTYFTKDLYTAIEVLKDLKNYGYRPIILSRRFPEEFRINAEFYWLSDQGLNKLEDIYSLVANLDGWKNAVLLDIDYLLSRKNFEDIFTLIQKLKDVYYILNKGIIVIYSGKISEEEEKFIKSECLEIRTKVSMISPEYFEILKLVYTKSRIGERPSIKDIMSELGVTRNTIKKRIAYLVDKGLLRVIKEGREKVLEITEEGKAILVDTF